MVTEPLPDWIQKALLVGTYNDLPILVQIDSSGLFSGGLGAYADRYVQTIERTSTGVDLDCDSLSVPAGELYIVTHVSAYHNDPIPRDVVIHFRESTTGHVLLRNQFLLEYEIMDKQGLWVLKEDDFIRAVFVTPASGKKGYLMVSGYKTEDLT